MNKEQILSDFAKWLDDQLDFKKIIGGLAGAAVELADGAVFSAVFKTAINKVPDEYQDEVLSVLKSVMEGNYQSITDEAIDIAVSRVNTSLGDKREKIILGGISKIVFDLIAVDSQKIGGVGQGPPDKDPD